MFFYWILQDPIKEHAFSSEELRKTEEKILEVSNGIKRKEFNPKKGNHCNWCDYKYLACMLNIYSHTNYSDSLFSD